MKRALRHAWWALKAVLAAACGLSIVAVVGFACVRDTLIDEALFARPLDPVLVTDRDGIPLRHTLPDGLDRRWVTLDEAGPNVVQAFLAAEDARFYDHGAVDPIALVRAFAVDVVPGGRVSGASTITQQVVKLVYGRPHGMFEKPIEIARAIELERRFTKDEILEQYLNRVPMGNGIVGVQRASEAYFGRPPSELSLGEAALLAGIPQAPSITEPRRHPTRARRRRAYVLDRIALGGLRSEQEVSRARTQPIEIARGAPRPFRAPRLVDRVLTARREQGMSSTTVRSALSWPLTDEIDHALLAGLAPMRERGATNASAIVIGNDTGEILAYVAAVDEAGEGGALDLLAARRQPGSTLKPFAYALFFESGATPATPVDDLSRPMRGRAGTLYLAGDFDGRERGPVSARLALASSLNLAALDVVSRVGPDHFVDRLIDLGFVRATNADRESAAMVLGGIDITALELAGAYVTLARGGTRVPLTMFPSEAQQGERVIDASAARLVTDVLSDAQARRAGFGRDLVSDQDTFALKTGTSTGFHDAWTAVYDADFTVVVWVGDASGEPMDEVTGFEGAAPLAVRALALARARRGELVADREEPLEIALATLSVCAQTGLLPGPRCHHVVRERFDAAALPHELCHAHEEDGTLALAPRYASWAHRARPSGVVVTGTQARTTPPRVAYPREGSTLLAASSMSPEIVLRAASGNDVVDDARFEIDGAMLHDARYRLVAGHHVVTAMRDGRRSEPVGFDVIVR